MTIQNPILLDQKENTFSHLETHIDNTKIINNISKSLETFHLLPQDDSNKEGNHPTILIPSNVYTHYTHIRNDDTTPAHYDLYNKQNA